MEFVSHNPATEEIEAEFPNADPGMIESALSQASAAQTAWRDLPVEIRAEFLRQVAARLRARAPELADLAAREMGKPLREGLAEVEKCAWGCTYTADHAQDYFGPTPVSSDATRSYVRYEPLGAILAVMPWNFPYWQIFRFGAAALLAGNVIVLKHAPTVPRCALALESVVAEASRSLGLPAEPLRNLFAPVSAIETVVAHPAIAAVTLTGSERAGRSLAAVAGRQLKKAVLELGGSDPFIVLADADLESTVGWAVRARVQNNGQSCIAAKRFLVEASIADRFVEQFRAALARLTVGDPLDPATDIGPLARADLRDLLARQVEVTIQEGARCLLGGTVPNRRGYYYPPTLLDRAQPGMTAMDEETFGPVAVVCRVDNPDHAVAVANQSRYGLGASIWSRDTARAEGLASRLEAGNVFINGMVKSDPRLPFGGTKCSGYGRELSVQGAREFVNAKTVWVG
ncbi:MAG: NAD-dependent succinate-semialdehyde dehydrogenase [Candidatus Eisenbacteria bacterium]|nr:NAD-dependent succinate-semialdehyde dehydrogenase [Candidatus Eisenbacteria bacterium]